jgi:hypothetical protein
MLKKIYICAIIALILVPASVMAAGFGGRNAGLTSGQGLFIQDGHNCSNQSAQQATGIQMQYRYFGKQNGVSGTQGALYSGSGQGDFLRNQTRSMLRLHDGSCGACRITT